MIGLKLLLFGAFLLVLAIVGWPQLRWADSSHPHERGLAIGTRIYITVAIPVGIGLIVVGALILVF